MHAYCYASGHIEFGRSIPDGAMPVARGPAKKLRDLIEATARHGYRSHRVRGRVQKIPGTECLLIPGVPEAPDQFKALDALQDFTRWIKSHAPKEVTISISAHKRKPTPTVKE